MVSFSVELLLCMSSILFAIEVVTQKTRRTEHASCEGHAIPNVLNLLGRRHHNPVRCQDSWKAFFTLRIFVTVAGSGPGMRKRCHLLL